MATAPNRIDPKIIDRISKLLALAAGTSSVHEARSAERQALELMRKHMVSASDLESHRYVIRHEATRWHRIPGWASLLMHTICGFVGVYDLYISGSGARKQPARWVLSGLPGDVDNVLYLFDALVARLDLHCRDFAGHGRPSRHAVNDFRNGWIEAVHANLSRIAQQVFPHATIERAIVPVEKRRTIEAWYLEETGQRPRLSNVAFRLSEGYYDGMRSGSQVRIAPGVGERRVPVGRRLKG